MNHDLKNLLASAPTDLGLSATGLLAQAKRARTRRRIGIGALTAVILVGSSALAAPLLPRAMEPHWATPAHSAPTPALTVIPTATPPQTPDAGNTPWTKAPPKVCIAKPTKEWRDLQMRHTSKHPRLYSPDGAAYVDRLTNTWQRGNQSYIFKQNAQIRGIDNRFVIIYDIDQGAISAWDSTTRTQQTVATQPSTAGSVDVVGIVSGRLLWSTPASGNTTVWEKQLPNGDTRKLLTTSRFVHPYGDGSVSKGGVDFDGNPWPAPAELRSATLWNSGTWANEKQIWRSNWSKPMVIDGTVTELRQDHAIADVGNELHLLILQTGALIPLDTEVAAVYGDGHSLLVGNRLKLGETSIPLAEIPRLTC